MGGETEILMLMMMKKKLGHHCKPSDHFLADLLRRKVLENGDVDFNFPVIERNMYSKEPWEVLKDDDPWEVVNPTTDKLATELKRVIFVFTQLKPIGKKRFARTAGDGKWHGSTADEPVRDQDGVLTGCFKSYLDFRLSKNLESKEKGHWMMHEYKFKGLESMINNNTVLCQITHVVNKDSGIHRAWPKSPFQILFCDFKSKGFFESRPKNKRQEPSSADDDDDEQVQNKRRKEEAFISGPTSEVFEYDDMIDIDFLDAVALVSPNDTDDMQIIMNSQENSSQLVVYGDEDDRMLVTNNLDVRNQEFANQPGLDLAETAYEEQQNKNQSLVINDNLDNDENEEFANQLEKKLMETGEKDDQENMVVNAEESMTEAIPTEDKETANQENSLMGTEQNEDQNDNLDHAGDGELANNLNSHLLEREQSENEKNMVSPCSFFDDCQEELAQMDDEILTLDTPHVPLPWEDL